MVIEYESRVIRYCNLFRFFGLDNDYVIMNDIFLKNFILWTQFVESCWLDYKKYWIEQLTEEKPDISNFSVKPWFRTSSDSNER